MLCLAINLRLYFSPLSYLSNNMNLLRPEFLLKYHVLKMLVLIAHFWYLSFQFQIFLLILCPNMCSHSNFKFDLLTSSLKWHIFKKRPLYNSAFFRPFSISKFVIHCVLKHKNVFTLYKLLMLLMPKGK